LRITGFGKRDFGRDRPIFSLDFGNGLTRLAGQMRTTDKQFVAQARCCRDAVQNLTIDAEIRSTHGRDENGTQKKFAFYESFLSTLPRLVQAFEQNRDGYGDAKQEATGRLNLPFNMPSQAQNT
jgi:hypothetical protein